MPAKTPELTNSKILHVAGLEKFIPPFIKFVAQQVDGDRHTFFLTGDEKKHALEHSHNITLARSYPSKLIACIDLLKKCCSADKIILHGLSDTKIIAVLFTQPWLLKKCYWVIWGADLYSYQLAVRTWRWRVKEFFRRPVIKHIGHLVTYIEGDVEFARKWYGARGQYHECIMYLSNVYREYSVPQEAHSSVNIQVGNSADPSNNHLEIFEQLLLFRDREITLFVPLSYGDQEYAKEIIEAGTKMFGQKFKPMIDFMPFDEYLAFLGKIDIAIFNHKRQQAMGNTITLLGLGKKVYLRSDVTPWAMLEKNGVSAYDVANISLTPIDSAIRERNKSAIKKIFSERKLLSQLKQIFEE
ncbi:TDP-N-acetylfucosamine:lipid II N-acetylfucosaminyltransferase [Pseudomonas sp. 65/3-MNA-CIBAN-0223]|uniref:TDP-N-acetylfucosamine:lipid II N-acetylfucosaminyltransferase n=1 Tax=Pseudomonas sp. 65/3-MNA-CIBAN-0223 TaxID=3140476 RepID=UPI00331BA304